MPLPHPLRTCLFQQLQTRDHRIALSTSAMRWLHVLARHYETPVAVLRRQLRTTRALEMEIVRLLTQLADREAARLLADSERPDRDAQDLYTRALRTTYLRLRNERDERERPDAEALVARIKAAQHGTDE